jgi:hypothetical protein
MTQRRNNMDKDTVVLVNAILEEAKKVEGIQMIDVAMLLALCKLITAIDLAGRRIANAIV